METRASNHQPLEIAEVMRELWRFRSVFVLSPLRSLPDGARDAGLILLIVPAGQTTYSSTAHDARGTCCEQCRDRGANDGARRFGGRYAVSATATKDGGVGAIANPTVQASRRRTLEEHGAHEPRRRGGLRAEQHLQSGRRALREMRRAHR